MEAKRKTLVFAAFSLVLVSAHPCFADVLYSPDSNGQISATYYDQDQDIDSVVLEKQNRRKVFVSQLGEQLKAKLQASSLKVTNLNESSWGIFDIYELKFEYEKSGKKYKVTSKLQNHPDSKFFDFRSLKVEGEEDPILDQLKGKHIYYRRFFNAAEVGQLDAPSGKSVSADTLAKVKPVLEWSPVAGGAGFGSLGHEQGLPVETGKAD